MKARLLAVLLAVLTVSPSPALAISPAQAAVPAAVPAAVSGGSGPVLPPAAIGGFVVRYRAGTTLSEGSPAPGAARSGASLRTGRALSGGLRLVALPAPASAAAAAVIAARLRSDPSVLSVEADPIAGIADAPVPATVPGAPNDTYYASYQAWDLDGTWGIAMRRAWEVTQGAASVTVAVIDTGITAHPDLDANIVAGYDFISTASTANDGGGRDSDPSDPGDWITSAESATTFAGCATGNSSWHGTHVAGTIAAVANNGIGVAGIAPGVRVLPVRVLGKCGGSFTDIADGVRWAAGGTVAGVPANTHPAKVLNLSLGGTAACPAYMQSAIDDAVSRGAVVVVAAGNSGALASTSAPANCTGVIVVAATGPDGKRASYSNYGPAVTIAAPGGSGTSYIASTVNTGTTSPVAAGYGLKSGTSMATPHIAAIAALMASVAPSMTPAALRTALTGTAQPFAADAAANSCTSGACGSGIASARGAVAAALPAKMAQAVAFGAVGVPMVGGTAALSATATSGLAAAITLDATAACSLSGSVLSYLAPGTCTVRAASAGDDVWAAAQAVLSLTPPVPACSPQSASGLQDVALSGTADCAGFLGLSPSYAIASGPAHGTAGIGASTGAWTYTPSPSFYGPDSFSLAASDANGTSAPATVSVSVARAVTPPGAPTGLAASPSGPGSLHLSWTGPADDGGSAVTGFEVRVRTGAGAWGTPSATGSTGLSFGISGLADGGAYDIEARAVSAQGAGAWSAQTSASTFPAVGITAVTAGVGAVTAAWSVPDADPSAGALTGFLIESSPDGSAWSAAIEAGPDWRSARVGALAQGLPARVRITARYGSLSGPASTAGPVDTLSAGAPSVMAEPSGLRAVRASWSLPATAAAAFATRVEMAWTTDGWASETRVSLPAAATWTMITGLPDGAPVAVRARAFYSVGDIASAWSDPAAASATPLAAPDISAADGIRSARIAWSMPGGAPGNSLVTGFQVEWQAAGASSWTTARVSGTTWTISGLADGAAVTVRVRARYGAVDGPASADVAAGALALGAPSLAAAGGPGAVAASWSMPPGLASSALIGRYETVWSTDGGASWSSATGTAANRAITGLASGATLSVRVRAWYGLAAGPWSDTAAASATILSAPAVAVSGGVRSAAASWSMPPGDPANALAAKYGVEWSTDEGATWTAASSVPAARAIAGLPDASLVMVRVRAYYAAVIGAGATAAAWGPYGAASAVTLALAAPVAVSAAPAGAGAIRAAWSMPDGAPANSRVTRYTVERSADGSAWTASSSAASPLAVAGLGDGTAWLVRVRAWYGAVAGPASDAVPAATWAAPVIGAVSPGVGYVQASWTPDTGTTAYTLEWSTSGGATWSGVTTASAYASAGPLPADAASVLLRLRSRYGAVTGPVSATATAYPVAPAAPAVSVRGTGSRSVTLDWVMPDGAPGNSLVTAYRVEVSPDGAVFASAGTTTAMWRTQGVAANGTAYVFRVRALYGSVAGPASEPVSATAVPWPVAYTLSGGVYGPVRFTATATDTATSETWTACYITTERTFADALAGTPTTLLCQPDAAAMAAVAAGHTVSVRRTVSFDRTSLGGAHYGTAVWDTVIAAAWTP